jgi:hypothetical protein
MNKGKRKEQTVLKSTWGKNNNEITEISRFLSIVTLNVNVLNSPIKRLRLADWIKNKIQLFVVYKKHIPKQRQAEVRNKQD